MIHFQIHKNVDLWINIDVTYHGEEDQTARKI